ncbi:MAG: hypothetical protein AB4368_13725 [Xenococcaceae cyanobacterium]
MKTLLHLDYHNFRALKTVAGHGAGKPTTKIIEEISDKWTFLVNTLGVRLS